MQPGDIAYVADTVTRVAAELGDSTLVLAFAGAPFTVASYLVEGRLSRTYEHNWALLYTDLRVARADGRPGGDGRGVRRRPARRRGSGVPTVRLRGPARSRSPTTTASSSPLTACSPSCRAAPGRTGDPFRHRVRPPPRVDGRRGGAGHRADWRTSIAAARKRLGDSLCSRAISTRHSSSPEGRRRRRFRRVVLADNGGQPGHTFNLGHGVHPSSDPGARRRRRLRARGDEELISRTGVVVDGVRHATPARRHRCALHGHPAWAAAERRPARRPHRPLRGDRRAQPARRAHRGATLGDRLRPRRCRPRRVRRRRRSAPRRSEHRGGRRRARRVGRRAGRRPRAGPALLDDVGGRLPRARRRAAAHGLPFVGIESWASEPAYVDYLAGVVKTGLAGMLPATRVLFTAHSLPRRILDTADPYLSRSPVPPRSPPTAGPTDRCRSPGSRPDGRLNHGSSRTCSA